MKRINLPLIGGIGYIFFMIGLAVAKTGEYTKHLQYQWYDPFWIGACFAMPFVMGWWAHEEHIKN